MTHFKFFPAFCAAAVLSLLTPAPVRADRFESDVLEASGQALLSISLLGQVPSPAPAPMPAPAAGAPAAPAAPGGGATPPPQAGDWGKILNLMAEDLNRAKARADAYAAARVNPGYRPDSVFQDLEQWGDYLSGNGRFHTTPEELARGIWNSIPPLLAKVEGGISHLKCPIARAYNISGSASLTAGALAFQTAASSLFTAVNGYATPNPTTPRHQRPTYIGDFQGLLPRVTSIATDAGIINTVVTTGERRGSGCLF